jgi:hypothetical protein
MKRVAIFVRRTVKKHEKMNVISWFEVLNLDLKNIISKQAYTVVENTSVSHDVFQNFTSVRLVRSGNGSGRVGGSGSGSGRAVK